MSVSSFIRRITDRALEFGSLFSRGINVVRGGSADMPFSAASHSEGLRSERWIDALFFWQEAHCKWSWEREVERSRENVLRAQQIKNKEIQNCSNAERKGAVVEGKSSAVGTITEFVIVIVAGLGLSMELPVFIACLLLASAGSVLARLFSTPPTRRALAVCLLAGNFVGILFGVANQHWFGFPPQLAFGFGGIVAVFLLPWFIKRFPSLADGALHPFVKGGGQSK